MSRNILTYLEYINESGKRMLDREGSYVETSYTPRWKDTPQRYLNLESNMTLKVLRYIWESGKEGRRWVDIQRKYFNLAHKGSVEFSPSKDRGYGSNMLYRPEQTNRQTGILHAHCNKNQEGKWVLTDSKLKSYFSAVEFSDLLDPDDFNVIDQLGLFDS